jgi:hypothetical protein
MCDFSWRCRPCIEGCNCAKCSGEDGRSQLKICKPKFLHANVLKSDTRRRCQHSFVFLGLLSSRKHSTKTGIFRNRFFFHVAMEIPISQRVARFMRQLHRCEWLAVFQELLKVDAAFLKTCIHRRFSRLERICGFACWMTILNTFAQTSNFTRINRKGGSATRNPHEICVSAAQPSSVHHLNRDQADNWRHHFLTAAPQCSQLIESPASTR